MIFLLNGGNYGGREVEVRASTTAVAVSDGDLFWLYDNALNAGQATAELVGVYRQGDERLSGVSVQTVSFPD